MEPPEPPPPVASHECEAAAAIARRIAANVARAVQVRPETLEHVLVALLAEGHVLVEDYPGVGKTALARALARSIDCQFARIQCTSDLLPADVVGTNVYDQREQRFEFRPGPVFANVVLVDEINRASPKTQSGLLECMQERRVTVDVHTHELARPFLVLATQNPIEYEGTYPLPEAQVDRFMVRISLGYPEPAAEAGMLADHEAGDRVLGLGPVVTAAEVLAAQDAAARVRASGPLRDYVVRLLWRTREDPRVDLGASPRAGLMLLRAAKAHAMMQGRDHALPDDVQALAEPVLAHRLVLAPESARAGGRRRDRRRGLGGTGVVVRRALGIGVAGVALTLIAFLFDTSPLFVLGAGLALLGIATPAWIVLSARGTRIERRLDDRRVIEDEPLEATIEVHTGRLRLPVAEVLDPLAAGPIPLPRRARSATIRVVVRFDRRGLRRLEPPSLIVRDPLDLARVVRVGTERPRELIVLPRTEPVNWVAAPAGTGAAPRPRSRDPSRSPRSTSTACAPTGPEHPPRASTGRRSRAGPACSSAACAPTATPARSSCSMPAGTRRADDVDAAVRAAASLALELAREGGCALLLPGERRPTPIEPDLAAWPAAHVRLALVSGGPGSPAPRLGGQARLGPMFYVAALSLERIPPAVLGVARGARVLVVPGPPQAEKQVAARVPGSNRPLRPSFEVSGCRGYVLRSRPGERAA